MSVLQNRFLQVDLFFFYLTAYESIFSLLSLQYCSNLLSISSANVLIFQWKNLILYNFSFNWKVAPAAATTSFNHRNLWVVSANIELLYEVTDMELKMDSTTHFSRYPKASYLSGKELHHRRICCKT